jgi:hypothetical protein
MNNFDNDDYNFTPKTKMKNWVKLAIGLVVLIILFANPFTRNIIRILLPMGSGMDDIIEIGALGGLILLLIYKSIHNKGWFSRWLRD